MKQLHSHPVLGRQRVEELQERLVLAPQPSEEVGPLSRPVTSERHRDAEWYDAVWGEVLSSRGHLLEDLRDRWQATIGYVIGSVLDLGFGLAEVYNMIGEREYLGVECSRVAIDYARSVNKNPNARFLEADLEEPLRLDPKDTVILTEVLEHVLKPRALAEIALALAKRRVVITVPIDMEDPSHVWPRWTEDKLRGLFHNLIICKTIDDYWLAVHEQHTVP